MTSDNNPLSFGAMLGGAHGPRTPADDATYPADGEVEQTTPAVDTGIVAFIEARLKEDEIGLALMPEPTHVFDRSFDRKYLLANIAKDRATLALHRPDAEPAPSAGALHCAEDGHAYPCQTVRLLAAIDADHEAYRPEWKPVAT